MVHFTALLHLIFYEKKSQPCFGKISTQKLSKEIIFVAFYTRRSLSENCFLCIILRAICPYMYKLAHSGACTICYTMLGVAWLYCMLFPPLYYKVQCLCVGLLTCECYWLLPQGILMLYSLHS